MAIDATVKASTVTINTHGARQVEVELTDLDLSQIPLSDLLSDTDTDDVLEEIGAHTVIDWLSRQGYEVNEQ